MNKHPANNGKVMLSIWIEAPLRDYVRARAMEAKQPVSEWAGNALRVAVLNTSLGAFCFPPEEYGAPGVRDPEHRCDMYSPGQPTKGGCQGDGHHLCAGCALLEVAP